MTSSPAGWYPQPDGRLRYWDGQQWTDHFAPGAEPPRPAARTRGAAAWFGWGGLALAVAAGALASGLSGAAALFGAFALVVGVVALVRGRVSWAHLHRRTSSLAVLAAAVAALAVSAAAAPAPPAGHHARRESAPSPLAMTDLPTPDSPSVAPAQLRPATAAPRPSARPRPRRQAPRTAAGDVIAPSGAVLPDRARTPGALNPAVTQATIDSTICVSGWTSTVRPSSSVTTDLKVAQLGSGYAYHGDTATGDYEEDHLISLELGGAPNDPRNLWPEPYGSPEGARVKDQVENKLHALVCSHALSLANAQHAIATDWWAAYRTYAGTPVSASSHPTPHHTTAPAPAPVPAGNGATARCNDGTYSFAAHHQGACSHHGGVQVFFK